MERPEPFDMMCAAIDVVIKHVNEIDKELSDFDKRKINVKSNDEMFNALTEKAELYGAYNRLVDVFFELRDLQKLCFPEIFFPVSDNEEQMLS